MGTFKTIKAGIAAALGALALFSASGEAMAYDTGYCREYTRTVYVGGRAENAYGRACLQPNGDWMIVDEDLAYNDIPDNVTNVNYVIRDYNRTYVPERVVYYGRPQVNIYRSRAVSPIYAWYNGGHYYKGKHVVYKKQPNRYNRDRHDYRGKGRGHDRGRH